MFELSAETCSYCYDTCCVKYSAHSCLPVHAKSTAPRPSVYGQGLAAATSTLHDLCKPVSLSKALSDRQLEDLQQVFEIWQRRQILKASVVTPALQLMAKLRAEHDLAQAAAEPVFRLGQAMEGRRPMRVSLPCVPLHSQTGLPEHVVHLMLDQWASLAGFRYAALHVTITCYYNKNSNGNEDHNTMRASQG